QRHGHTPVVCPARNDGLGATGVSPVLPWKHGQDARGTRQDSLDRPLAQAIDSAVSRGLEYLATRQRPDGSWVPLWFGNQHHPEEENPVYGTARVLLAYRDLDRLDDEPARRGLEWLRSAQNADGGWGGAFGGTSRGSGGEVSSVEETAVAVEALASAENGPHPQPTTGRGVTWLVTAVESGRHRETSPIGFYFARLWYYERLYPLIFSVSALGRALRRWGPEPDRP
ncbi:MAG: prenyltransferase/squalene oxidase repeat-containing protein, partial [Planctomycetota bacterium]